MDDRLAIAAMDVGGDGEAAGALVVGRRPPDAVGPPRRLVEAAGDEKQLTEPQRRLAEVGADLFDGSGERVVVELDERFAAPASARSLEMFDRRRPVTSTLGVVGSGDVIAELPQVDLDVRRWGEGDHLVLDAQHPRRLPRRPPRLEHRRAAATA